jgi:hypothetical protein
MSPGGLNSVAGACGCLVVAELLGLLEDGVGVGLLDVLPPPLPHPARDPANDTVAASSTIQDMRFMSSSLRGFPQR